VNADLGIPGHTCCLINTVTLKIILAETRRVLVAVATCQDIFARTQRAILKKKRSAFCIQLYNFFSKIIRELQCLQKPALLAARERNGDASLYTAKDGPDVMDAFTLVAHKCFDNDRNCAIDTAWLITAEEHVASSNKYVPLKVAARYVRFGARYNSRVCIYQCTHPL